MARLEDRLRERARAAGFDAAGIARATEADGFARFTAWLDAGHAAGMTYLADTAAQRRHPAGVMPSVRSVLMVALNYLPPPAPGPTPAHPPGHGRVARYARGADYHRVIRERLKGVLAWLRAEVPGCWGRVAVDTAPLLERDFARRAGLGWFGKNTLLLDTRLGSYFLLGALLLDLDLAPDEPFEAAHCGTCTACLDACPTNAFPAPHVLDAGRCVSYLTIELQDALPAEELRAGLGDWLYGCDVCQEVCPWNRRAPVGAGFPGRADLASLDPVELLGLSPAAYAARFAGTVLLRPGRGGVLRNAALVLGNRGGPECVPALRRALDDADAMVREAAAWALKRVLARTEGQGGGEGG